jgi:hypothetical protein
LTYQEKEITKNQLAKFVKVLDLDEGIRIENKTNMIFLNKSAKRYCINTSTKEKEEFVYRNTATEVLDFLKDRIEEAAKIFSY